MSTICGHHIIKPFVGGDRGLPGFQEETVASEEAKEYCTHPNSLHLPGSLVEATCGGDIARCDIPGPKR
jgi:hypothetical protein